MFRPLIAYVSAADRIKLTTSIIETDLQLGGASVSPHHFIHHPLHSLAAFFPLEQVGPVDPHAENRDSQLFDSPSVLLVDYL